jgi:methionine-rich copper-binding protein CopC
VGVLINTSLGSTTTALISSQNPSNFGQAVTFTATVTSSQFFKFQPTGTVSFYDGTTNIGNSNLNSGGVATLTTSTLAVGTHSMTATYNGDTNFVPSTSPVLYQVVQGAIASLSPGSLNFGNQTLGITSSPQNVTLTNSGNINLTISLIQITGTNSGDFNQTNNCPSSLSPNNSCQIGVTYTPTATGTRNAAVSITDNAPNSPQSVSLTGVGVSPAVTFSPTSLTFLTRLVFTTSPAQKVTLTNSGEGILTIKHISATGPFKQTNDCPSSLNPGANCTITIKFHPTTKGVFHDAVSVTDNAPANPQKVPLTGTGTYVQLVPTKLNFGTQPVGTRSLAKKITLTNKGSVAVNISGIAITGTDAGDFAETNTCGKSVASGASCFIKVTFKPLVKGKRTADVSVYDNGGGSPQEVGLIGTGT